MGLDNPIHILFILILALLVFGAKRLPEMGRSLGEGMRGFKDSINSHTPATQLTPMSVSATSPVTSPESVAAETQVPAPSQVAAEPAHQVSS